MTVIFHPGTPATPAIPDTLATIDTPSWNAGAISIPVISTPTGGYEWKVPAGVVGVVCGLADNYDGVGYASINHALYFSHGAVEYMEFGVQSKSLGSYLSGDTWVMARVGASVMVFRNGVLELRRSITIPGPFILAGTTYLQGDTIVDAKVTTLALNRGDIAGEFPSISGQILGQLVNQISSSFKPITGTLAGNGNGAISASFKPITGRVGNHITGDIAGELPLLSGYLDSGMLAPAYGYVDTRTLPITGEVHGLTGQIGGISSAVRHLTGRIADRRYGDILGEFSPLAGFMAQQVSISIAILAPADRCTIRANGSPSDANGVDEYLPSGYLTARSGAQARLAGPSVKMEASGTVTLVGRAELVGPALLMTANGYAGTVGDAELVGPGRYALRAIGGGRFTASGPGGYALDAGGLVGAVGLAALTLPGGYALDAAGAAENVGAARMVGPALVAAPTGEAWLVGPSLQIYALGGEVVATSYEAYSINLKTGAVTRYTNFPFDNVLRFGDKFFGVKADGVFELTGDTDDGQPISATITTFFTDFASANFKRVPWVYVVGRLGGSLGVTVAPAGGTPYTYPSAGAYTGQTLTHRARVGRGIKATRYSFSFDNNGHAFELDRVEAVVDVLTRAM